MSRAVGSNAIIKFCQEANWGVTPASPSIVYGINLRSETLGSSRNLFESEMINQYRTVIGLGEGNKAVAGGFTSDLLPEGLEVMFMHLLGNPTVSTTGSGPYTHVMKGSSGYLQGMTVEKGFSDINQFMTYTGCRVNSMTLNLVQEGFHDVTFDLIGKAEALNSTSQIGGPAPVYGNKNGFTGYQCTISIDAGAGYVDLTNIVSGSITINNNIETDGYVLGSAFRASAQYGKRSVEGNLSVFFEDATMYGYYANGTEVKLKFTFDNGIGQQMIFEFTKCKLGGESPKIASAGGLNLPMTFRARYDTDTSTDVTLTIVNTLSSIATPPVS